MNNPLDSIKGTIISGVILSIIVIYALASSPASIYNGILRAIHAFAGIAWIGLLYYFNFVQVPALKAAVADGSAGGILNMLLPLHCYGLDGLH